MKIELPVTCLATMAYVYVACTVHVTIFSTGSKFRPVSKVLQVIVIPWLQGFIVENHPEPREGVVFER